MAYIKWTLESLKIEALEYSTRYSFQLGNKSAYQSAQRRGWLDEICQHMKPCGNLYKRLIYAYEFSDNHVYVGLTFSSRVRQYEHTTNILRNQKSAVLQHILKTHLTPIFKELTNYLDVETAVKREEEFLSKYRNDGWIILNKAKTGAIGLKKSSWTVETCKEVAKQYSSREEFRKENSSAYYFAYKSNIMNKVCSHMAYSSLPNGYWTYERCLEEAKKSTSRSNFKIVSPKACGACWRNYWMNSIAKELGWK